MQQIAAACFVNKVSRLTVSTDKESPPEMWRIANNLLGSKPVDDADIVINRNGARDDQFSLFATRASSTSSHSSKCRLTSNKMT